MGGATALLASVLVAACSGSNGSVSSTGSTSGGAKPFAGQTIRFGGPSADIINDIRQAGFDQKFKDETGATIQWIPGSAPDNLQKLIQSRGGPAPFDVVDLDSGTQPRGIQAGVLAKLDKSKLTSSGPQLGADAFPNPGYGPQEIYIRLGSCVNVQAYKKAGLSLPDSIDAWADPKLAGHIFLPSPSNFYWVALMPVVAQSMGTGLDNPGPVVDRFKAIKAQGYFTSSSQAQTAVQSGDAWLTTITDGRCFNLKLGGSDVAFQPLNITVGGKQWKWIGSGDTLDIVQGAKNPELATKFIDMMLDLGAKVTMEKNGYVPSRQDLEQLGRNTPRLAPIFEGFKADEIYYPSSADINKFYDSLNAWTLAWNKAFAK